MARVMECEKLYVICVAVWICVSMHGNVVHACVPFVKTDN